MKKNNSHLSFSYLYFPYSVRNENRSLAQERAENQQVIQLLEMQKDILAKKVREQKRIESKGRLKLFNNQFPDKKENSILFMLLNVLISLGENLEFCQTSDASFAIKWPKVKP